MTTPLLRFALAADAAASGATALLLILAPSFVAALTHLPSSLLFYAGLSLVPFIAFLVYAATRPAPPRGAVLAIIDVNLLWAAANFGLLVSGLVAPNALGVAFVAGQALAVLGLAALQFMALRQPVASAA